MVVEVRQDPVYVIDFERATDALRRLSRRHHEVLDEKLAATVEQVRQRELAFRGVKNVFLIDLHPRQRPSFRSQLIAQPSQFFLPFEQVLARNQPLGAGDNFMLKPPGVRAENAYNPNSLNPGCSSGRRPSGQ